MLEKNRYEDYRANYDYYRVIKKILCNIQYGANSILDVGSNGINLLDCLNIPLKMSIDLKNPAQGKNIISIKHDFMTYEFKNNFDIVCCFQVLEHIEDVHAFVKKLKHIGKNIIISVPYRWPHVNNSEHIHDPVNEEKLFLWFERSYDISINVFDKGDNVRRLIACYFNDNINFIDQFTLNKNIKLYDMKKNEDDSICKLLKKRSEREYLISKHMICKNIIESKIDSEVLKNKIKLLENEININRKEFTKLAQEIKKSRILGSN